MPSVQGQAVDAVPIPYSENVARAACCAYGQADIALACLPLQDGTIEYAIKLTGELSTNALSKHELDMGSGQYSTTEINAQNHQHMSCARPDYSDMKA